MLYTKDMGLKTKKVLRVLKKSVRLKTMIFLILILVINVLGWYIYVSEVSSDITTHVKAWKIDFDNSVNQDIDFIVEDIYPGMETQTKEIELTNGGEMDAVVSGMVTQMRILEDTYVADGTDVTSEDLIDSLSNDYPFSVKFYMDGEEITQKDVEINATATIVIEISWPFESGDDATDTYWGNAAYDFMNENPDTPCIQISAKVIANQKE